jgi:hypothetical protein
MRSSSADEELDGRWIPSRTLRGKAQPSPTTPLASKSERQAVNSLEPAENGSIRKPQILGGLQPLASTEGFRAWH